MTFRKKTVKKNALINEEDNDKCQRVNYISKTEKFAY